jgi:hypothetical protein
MNSDVALPLIGTTVTVRTVRLVPCHPYKAWDVIAEADVPVPGEGHNVHTLLGHIPLQELSPYEDFDPARENRSLSLRQQMAAALLTNADRRFVVIDHTESGGELVLSLKQALLQAQTVQRSDHEPPYEVRGFRRLGTLFFQLLKHPLGLGGAAANTPALLDTAFWSDGTLQRLKQANCPAVHAYEQAGTLLAEENPCAGCVLTQKLKCLQAFSWYGVRQAYENEAIACVAEASDPTYPRHYHYCRDTGDKEQAVLVFMDHRCRKVIATRREGPYFTIETFFRPPDCDPAAPDARSQLLAERARILLERRKHISRTGPGMDDIKICIPSAWGYQP